jgi:diguanylate cyclase (GGDEF)-like protein/PAS domain S-box-containing protein
MDYYKRKLEMDIVNEKIQKIIFDIIFQHVQDMVFVMKVEKGPAFRYIFVNEAGLKKANLPLDVIGKTMIEVLPYEIAINLQKNYQRLLTKKEIMFFDDVFLFNDGKKIYGETILTPIFNEKNSINYVVAVTRDVTEWSIEKNKIIESEQRYRSIVDHNLDAIFTINRDGEILEANPAAVKMTGYTEQQMINKSISHFINHFDLAEFKVLLEKTITGSALESLDCKIIHSNGQFLMVHLKTVPIVIYGEISGVYLICKDVSEQAKNMETIKFMAFHDQLTGLLNRRALLEKLNDLINMSDTNYNEFALISIDLDRFKFLNDTLGHLAGDELLKRVAERLGQFQNEQCFVYRQGGDEFSILLVNTNRESTVKFVQKVFSEFVQSFYYHSHEYYISPSIGISMYPNDGKNAETLIKNADEALFRVKDKGKAHYQFYRTEMNSVITNVLTLETHLRKAVDKDELYLVFQPQIDITTAKTSSFEALLRWNNTAFGLISPSVFIPLAEDTGLIIPIGHWVIEKTCEQIRNWHNKGFSNIRVAINISAIQFQQHNLVGFIRNMIERYNIPAAALEIEITEGAMQDTKETIPILKKLKQLGITISVDDFGTGYSSLNYLKHFPIDVLKIDQSFIKDILVDEKAAAITSSIIHLGRSLGLEVVAEGVENSSQVEFLKNQNCHKIQGYYYSKPIPANKLEEKFLAVYHQKENRCN